MTIYGRYNKELSALEIISDSAYSQGEWQTISYHENATEARREFDRHKNGERLPVWTSVAKWNGTY